MKKIEYPRLNIFCNFFSSGQIYKHKMQTGFFCRTSNLVKIPKTKKIEFPMLIMFCPGEPVLH